MNDFEGHCLCGAIRFALTPPTLFFAHCHCRYCREAHGAAFISWVGAAEARFRFLPESTEPRWYQSSEQSRRGFCGHCGSTLFFASTLCPGEIHVARPAIPGPIDREPQCHVFYDQRVDWHAVGDQLPRYTSDEPGLAKFKAVRR
ncbi:MAG: GFA family protein [Steroidobacteraceae bacterium]